MDISRLPEFIGPQRDFLPVNADAAANLLPFASRILDLIESVAFYAGVVVSVFVGLRALFNRIRGRRDEDVFSVPQATRDATKDVEKVETVAEPVVETPPVDEDLTNLDEFVDEEDLEGLEFEDDDDFEG